MDYDAISDDNKDGYVSRAQGQLGPEHQVKKLGLSKGVDYDTISDDDKDGYLSRSMSDLNRQGWASMTVAERAANVKQATTHFQKTDKIKTVTVVVHREEERDIWREVLVMNSVMTPTSIDNFMATPIGMGSQTEYNRLQVSLYLRAARASADVWRPADSPPLSNAE